ncbi:MAG: protein kinase [Acidobacteriia bacterium]|nr:protein kinase [Terriglobia bacterium]
MDRARWQRVKGLLDEAIALAAVDRPSFLDRACDGDAALRREVDSLLSSHEQAGTGFLKTPAVDLRSAGPAAPARTGQRIGVYEIVEQIGQGGMGEVYRAVRADGQYTKEVAVKLVRGGRDSAFVLERFRNERQILATLDHPNIARLLDGGTTDDGVPYLVMELIEGVRIDSYCDAHTLSITERRAHSFDHGAPEVVPAGVWGSAVRASAAGHSSRYQAQQYSGEERGRAEAAGLRHRENPGSGSGSGDHAGAADDSGVCQPRTDSRPAHHDRQRRIFVGRRALPVAHRSLALSGGNPQHARTGPGSLRNGSGTAEHVGLEAANSSH